MLTNIQSIHLKKELLMNKMITNNILITIINETWLKQEQEFSWHPYNSFEWRRTNERGGGVAILIHPSLISSQI